MLQVDARGRSCPEPLLMVKKALKQDAAGLEVVVNDFCAVENISRYAGNNGYDLTRTEQDGEVTLTLTKK